MTGTEQGEPAPGRRASRPGRRPTATSNFGVGRRESHDSSAFYARFAPPEISDDDTIERIDWEALGDPLILGDARRMAAVPDRSVALVVTSPPYFVGKDYEADVRRAEVPASYVEYLDMLRAVFAECKRVLEPGGRIAVNVANLGRKPYRSLSSDVIAILQDDLGLLLRGEVIWQKGKGSTGSCAWGTFRSATNPVLRDLTERVIIASKGRLDRARSPEIRRAQGLPHQDRFGLNNDEFLAATLDVWDIPPESAKRVGHPAPFPIDLAKRLIHLYTYEEDVVLDPFLGSGSTAVAAKRWHRKYVGYDLDPGYLELARARVARTTPVPDPDEAAMVSPTAAGAGAPGETGVPALSPDDLDDHFQARATREGKAAQALAEQVILDAGFHSLRKNVRVSGLGLTINVVALDQADRPWNFDVSGAFTTTRGGLLRTDTVWKCLGRANVLAANGYGGYDREPEGSGPVVFLTSHLPKRGSDGDKALRRAGRHAFFDALAILGDADQARLARYASGEEDAPLPGFWTDADLA